MRFQCPCCYGVVAVDEEDAGQAVACGHCNNAVAVPTSRLTPGAVIGDCVIRKELGEGGMGRVFLAHQLSLDRNAALKVLHSQFSQDESYINDFIKEARAAAKLNHPNIVQAYAVGEDEGIYYFAMEYVEGSTLKQVLIHGGRIIIDRALVIAEEIAKALDVAWKNQKLVHRDIKPDNIILTGSGEVKLADLGLAHIVTDVRENVEELFGTPQYIAPEQLLGQSGDNRSDIYSLGATLYHALTGSFPYSGQNAADIARKHLVEPLRAPEEVVEDIPANVSQLVQIMLAKRPEHRYQDSGELCADIARVRQGEFPKRALPEGAQEPLEEDDEEVDVNAAPVSAVEVDTAEPSVVVDTTTPKNKKKLKIRVAGSAEEPTAAVVADVDEANEVNKKPKLTVKVPDGVAASQTPSVSETQSPNIQLDGKSKRPLIVAAVVGVVVLAIAALAGMALLGDSDDKATTTGGGLSSEEIPAEQAQEYDQIVAMVKKDADSKNILTRADQFLKKYGRDSEIASKLERAITPAVESEIAQLRTIEHDKELARWSEQSKEIQEEERVAQKERQQRELEEQERYRREQIAQRENAARQQHLALMREQQQELRQKAIELCRQHKYNEAHLLFVPMAQAREEEFQNWALMKQNVIENAEKAYNLVYNTKDKLKGVKLQIAGKPGRSKVHYISRRHVEISFLEVDYVEGEMVERVKENYRLPLLEIKGPQMWLLCQESSQKDGGDQAELNLNFGSYLLARGTYPQEARRRLQSSGMSEEIEPMLAELTVIEELVKEQQWARGLERLQLLINQGDAEAAKRLALYLRKNFPQEFADNEQRIMDMIKEQ